MMESTAMKVALVTGANKGIGLETARQLAQQGFTVLLGSRDETRGRQAAERLKAEGLATEPVKLDVTRDADRKAVARLVADRFGRLDVLINNAATARPKRGSYSLASEWLSAFVLVVANWPAVQL